MESIWSIYDQMKEELESDDDNPSLGNANENPYKDICYKCGEREFIVEDGCIICRHCGRVIGQEIDYNQEWRFYGNDENGGRSDPTRCGIPINPLLPDSSLGTIILGNGQQAFRRLHRWNSSNPKERSLIQAYNQIQEKTAKANIPVCIVDKAKVLYKTLSSEKIKRGTTRKGLMAACIFYILKDKQISRSTREISTIFELKQKKMTTGCKYFNEIMYSKNKDYLNQIQPTTTADFIQRFSQKLSIDEKYQSLAIHICQLADKLGIISESTPPSIAVGCLYLMIQHFSFNITKKHLSEVCEISEVTISKSYKKLLEYKQYLIPDDSVSDTASISGSSSYSSTASTASIASGIKKSVKKPRKNAKKSDGRLDVDADVESTIGSNSSDMGSMSAGASVIAAEDIIDMNLADITEVIGDINLEEIVATVEQEQMQENQINQKIIENKEDKEGKKKQIRIRKKKVISNE